MNAYVLLLCCLTANLAHGTLTAAGAAATMSPSVPEWTAAAGATGKTVCSLSMQGWGGPPGLKKFQLSCTGGIITAQAHLALPKLVWPDPSNMPNQGVIWTKDKDCMPFFGCLWTICGHSDAVFVNSIITDVHTTSGPIKEPSRVQQLGDRYLVTALCISQGSRVTFQGCTFTSSTVRSLAAYGNTTSVLLDWCSITNNNLTIGDASSISDVIEREMSSLFKMLP